MPADAFQLAQEYWDLAADRYDDVFPNKITGQAQRFAVWQEFARIFHSGDHVLELNCGTGIDAVHLAERGIRVTACDISPRMILAARRRAALSNAGHLVDFQTLPTQQIAELGDRGYFDGAFSNFSGLNCVGDLSTPARDLGRLLKVGSHLLVCVIGRWVPIEIAWYFAHGQISRPLRRFRSSQFSRDGRVTVHYHSGAALKRIFAPEFKLRARRGISVVMPTQQFENWAAGSPQAFQRLARWDRQIGGLPILRNFGDCSLFDFERVAA